LLEAGVTPRTLMKGLGLDPWPLDALGVYNPDQPRVPAGQTGGGEWTSEEGGGSGEDADMDDDDIVLVAEGSEPSTGIDRSTRERARAIYGETASLRPALIDAKVSPDKPSNWNAESAAQLATARAYVGVVSDRNPSVHRDSPGKSAGTLDLRAWDQAVAAARPSTDGSQLDPRITHFFLRQDGIGPQSPPWPGAQRILSLGPFFNVGGGDVPRGPATYIDFYGK